MSGTLGSQGEQTEENSRLRMKLKEKHLRIAQERRQKELEELE